MVHTIIQNVTSLAFLLLAALLINDRWAQTTDANAIEALRKDLADVHMKNFMFLEGRINSVADRSDSYQYNVNSRLDVLEVRMKMLDQRTKQGTRITNNNSAVVNGVPQAIKEQQQEK